MLNNDQLESILPWSQHGGGEISILPGGSNGSPNTFASTGRLYAYGGPTHMLDVHCLTVGSKYMWKAQFKLLDSMNGNAAFTCDKTKPYGDAECCPFFTLVLNFADTTNPVYIHYYNTDTSDWVAGQFNYFETDIEITEQIHNATSAQMIFNGPRAGITILFDEAELELVQEDNCENLVPNGHFEVSMS